MITGLPTYRGAFFQKTFTPETARDFLVLYRSLADYQGFRLVNCDISESRLSEYADRLKEQDPQSTLEPYLQQPWYAVWKDEPKKPKLPG